MKEKIKKKLQWTDKQRMSNKYYPNTPSVKKIIMQIRDNLQKNLTEITKHEIRKISNQIKYFFK